MSAGLRCFLDHRVINPGQESDKRVEYWAQPDGSEKLFSNAVPDADGKLSEATGTLVKAAHSKCYFADRRQRERSDILPTPAALVNPRQVAYATVSNGCP